MKLKKKDFDHDPNKYVTTKFNKLTSEKFSARLAKANLASKNYIFALLKKTDFDEKLKDLNKNVTSNKTKHVLVKNKLNGLSKMLKQYQEKD